ncbi:type IV pilin protein [Bdellovibrio bacteriovorus]|uniref:type IV pilin protein n=1 Tax=Bdellovibrio bacteriovorus TaxID=959 RepID=UPI0029346404|nr:prepilin-type N-terminal cleavage/methylation domain-containing protein [Bdellovibrio bacteriovorus]
MFSSKRKSQSGFSLVELMVVVAIIGILASIAIPSINKYMAKARQAEAKTNLSSLYTAEKAFVAEFNAYTGGFQVVGYNPEGQLRYNVGFGNEGVTCATLRTSYGYTAACPTVQTNTNAYCAANTTRCTQLADGLNTNGTLTGVVNPSVNAFTAIAAGRIRNNGQPDRWSINETKNLINTNDGTQ